jgi:hypothetical protein
MKRVLPVPPRNLTCLIHNAHLHSSTARLIKSHIALSLESQAMASKELYTLARRLDKFGGSTVWQEVRLLLAASARS